MLHACDTRDKSSRMFLGQIISAWRKQNKISLRKAAKIIGIDMHCIRRLELGDTTLTADNLAKIQAWQAGLNVK